jgi:hypothetical protein
MKLPGYLLCSSSAISCFSCRLFQKDRVETIAAVAAKLADLVIVIRKKVAVKMNTIIANQVTVNSFTEKKILAESFVQQ